MSQRCWWAHWTPLSLSCLCWKPERRGPPVRWLHPSCPKEPMGWWCLSKGLLELQVRHTHGCTCQHHFMWLMFRFYFIASPQKPTDTFNARIPTSSGRRSFFYYCSALQLSSSRVNCFSLISRCEHASETSSSQTCRGFRSDFIIQIRSSAAVTFASVWFFFPSYVQVRRCRSQLVWLHRFREPSASFDSTRCWSMMVDITTLRQVSFSVVLPSIFLHNL